MGPITTGVRTVMVGGPKWKYPQNSELDYQGELEICTFVEIDGRMWRRGFLSHSPLSRTFGCWKSQMDLAE